MLLNRIYPNWAGRILALVAVATISVGGYIGINSKALATSNSSAKDDKNLISIKTYTRKNCTSTPILVADKLGFYKEEGLKIVYTGELKATEILPSILNGNNDFAEAHPNLLATYVAGGAKIEAIGRSIIEPTDPKVDSRFRHMRWFVNPKTGIKSWKDLINYKKGQKLTHNGLAPNCVTFIASVIFDKYKIGRKRLDFVNFDTDQAALQAVEQGSIDIACVHPPFYKLAADSGLTLIGDSSDSGLGEAAGLNLYYFTADFIKKHPDTIHRFARAMKKAQIWANEHPDEASKITSDFIGVTATGSHYYAQSTVIPEKDVQLWVDDLVNNNKLKKGQIKVSDLLTHKFEEK
jgi:ABC-type nitrate/sulfonate/bicarbonate transport system substrate-binding protein